MLYPLSYEGGPGMAGRLSLSRGGRDVPLKTRSLRKRRVGPRGRWRVAVPTAEHR